MNYKDMVQMRVKEVELLYNQVVRQMAGLRKNMEKLVKYANTIIESGEFDTQPYRMSDTAWQKRATETIRELVKIRRETFSCTNDVLSCIYIDLRDNYGVVLDQLRKDHRENNNLLRYPSAFEAISGDDMVRNIFDSILIGLFPKEYFEDDILVMIEHESEAKEAEISSLQTEDSIEPPEDKCIEPVISVKPTEDKVLAEEHIADIVARLAKDLGDTSFGKDRTFEYICDNMECHWGYLATQYKKRNQTQIAPSRYDIVVENERTRIIFERTAKRLSKIARGNTNEQKKKGQVKAGQ